MDSSICMTSSSSASSSPSLGFSGSETVDSMGQIGQTANQSSTVQCEELSDGDVVQVITQLTNTIKSKLCLYETNNNNNISTFNQNSTKATKASDNINASAKELSKLYAIRAQSYLKLGFHQLAFDDSTLGIQFDKTNANCYYLKGCDHSLSLCCSLSLKSLQLYLP